MNPWISPARKANTISTAELYPQPSCRVCHVRLHDVSSTDALSSRTKKVIHLTNFALLKHAENSTKADIAVNVAGSIEGIKGNAEFLLPARFHNDGVLILLRNKDGADTRVFQGIDHFVV
jgi:hypothetical protein